MMIGVDQQLQSAILKVRSHSPFFGTLILFARFIKTLEIERVATNGNAIFYNPNFVSNLKRNELEAVLLHEVLHCALLHGIRRGSREPQRWNIAADIVVNGIIAQQNTFTLPQGALMDEKLKFLPTEEVYELLPKNASIYKDLQDLSLGLTDGQEVSEEGFDKNHLASHWRNAMLQSHTISHGSAGWVPLGFGREFNELSASKINWKSELWRFLVQTPSDFTGFDRRFIGQGLYLDSLYGEGIDVDAVIDTSGSIDEELLSQFMAEIRAILRAYPHIHCRLFYADSDLYGPYELTRASKIPKPEGGGGTSFIPYFEYYESKRKNNHQISIYLTDGYGDFPDKKPNLEVLWVVAPGGLMVTKFPFGKVINARLEI